MGNCKQRYRKPVIESTISLANELIIHEGEPSLPPSRSCSTETEKDWLVDPNAVVPAPSLPKALSDIMTCPICLNDLQRPIHQCTNGHIVCDECLRKLVNCPICRQYFGAKLPRNLFLENLMETLLIKCSKKYCHKLFRTKEIMEGHAAICGGGVEPKEGSNIMRTVRFQCNTSREAAGSISRILDPNTNRSPPSPPTVVARPTFPVASVSLRNLYASQALLATQAPTQIELGHSRPNPQPGPYYNNPVDAQRWMNIRRRLEENRQDLHALDPRNPERSRGIVVPSVSQSAAEPAQT